MRHTYRLIKSFATGIRRLCGTTVILLILVTAGAGTNALAENHSPVIRIGKRPVVNNEYVTINLQIADWGCTDVTAVTVYYTQDGSTPTKSSSHWDFDLSESPINSNTNFTLAPQSIEAGPYKIMVTATNSSGEGDLSDMAEFVRTCKILRAGTIADAAVHSGNSTNITLSNVQGTSPSVVKWQKSDRSDFSDNVENIASTSFTISTGELTQTTFFRALVQDACGNERYSKVGTVAVASVAVLPTAVSSTPYTPISLVAVANTGVTWSVTSGNAYLLNTDHSIYTAGTDVKGVIVKPTSTGSVTVQATSVISNLDNATSTITVTADTNTCN